MKKQGVLTVLSGFSGAGKGTVMKRLLEKYPEQYALSISCTSRAPRPGEREGIEYFFKTREEFEKMIQEEKFLEYARYVDNYYGTPADYVLEQMRQGKDVILEIELQGALQIRSKVPDVVMIFLTTPCAKVLEQRLRGRGTESEEVIRARLERAVEESKAMDQYDYLVVNDDLETCVEEIHNLIQSQHSRLTAQRDFVAKIRSEINRFTD